jgi:nucleotide-binding universal stress UspA family protein
VKLETIVVAVDGSENSATAVEWAAQLAYVAGATVVAVHARGLLESVAAGDEDPREALRKDFEDAWCAPLDQRAIRTRRVLRDGEPVSTILAVADEADADLIVLGSRGVGVYPEQLLGSTSTQVAQRSTRPVTIIPGARPGSTG